MFSFKRSLIALVGILAIVGTLATLMPLISLGQSGNPLTRDPRKSYYLTQTQHNGGHALSACAAGYHMASLWEIHDPSNLRYDTQLGLTQDDSGFGPPTGFGAVGWVRTGFAANSSATAGQTNCNAWTSTSLAVGGTLVLLVSDWESTADNVSPWNATVSSCSSPRSVWCMQD